MEAALLESEKSERSFTLFIHSFMYLLIHSFMYSLIHSILSAKPKAQ